MIIKTLKNHYELCCDDFEEIIEKYIDFYNLNDIYEGVRYVGMYEVTACNFLENNKCNISINIEQINLEFIEHLVNQYNSLNKTSFTEEEVIDFSNMFYIFIILHELNHIRQYKDFLDNKLEDRKDIYMNYVAENTIHKEDIEFYEKFRNFNIIEYDANINAFCTVLNIYDTYDIKVSSKALKTFNMFMAKDILTSYTYQDEIYSPIESAIIMANEKKDKLPIIIKDEKDDKSFNTLLEGYPLKQKRLKKLENISTCKRTTKNLIKSLYK